jgi:SNF2 family DNA or RNA helicase
MSAKQEEEALKEFFASALTPEQNEEKDDTLDKADTTDDDIGIIQGLKVKLMKHQIEGLEFLQDHEFTTDTKDKGKGKYGGILADDVSPSLQYLTYLDGSGKDHSNISFDPDSSTTDGGWR